MILARLGTWLSAQRLVIDDRGCARSVRHAEYEPELEFEEPEEPVAKGAGDAGAAHARSGVLPYLWMMVPGVALLMLLSTMVWVVWGLAGGLARVLGLQGWPGQAAGFALVIGGLAGGFFAVRVRNAAASRDRAGRGRRSTDDEHGIRDSVGRRGVCFCCEHPLGPLPREADGCVACPECGAAWRIDDWAADGGRYRLPHDQAGQKPEAGFFGRNAWVRDARGVIVPVLAGVSPKKRARAVLDRAGPAAARRGQSRLIFPAGLAAAAMAVLAVWTLYEPLGGMLLAAVLTPVLGLVWTVQRRCTLDRCCTAIRAAALVENRCPCCDSVLRPTVSRIDACRLCDTCGSAWEPPETESRPRA